MILGAEIGLIVAGLIALVAGRFYLGKGRVVRGAPARCLGAAAAAALIPLALGLMFGTVLILGGMGVEMTPEFVKGIGAVIEIAVVVGISILVSAVGWKFSEPQHPTAEAQAPVAPTPATAAGPARAEVPEWWDEADAPRSGKATASLVFGLVSLGLSLLGSIPAFVLGISGLVDIKRSGGRVRGKGTAVAGVVLGCVGSISGLVVLSLLLPLLKAGGPGPGAGAPAVFAPAPAPQPARNAVAAKGARNRPPAANQPLAVNGAPANVPIAKKARFAPAKADTPPLTIDTKPVATGATLGGGARSVDGLAVVDVKVNARSVPRSIVWGGGRQGLLRARIRQGDAPPDRARRVPRGAVLGDRAAVVVD